MKKILPFLVSLFFLSANSQTTIVDKFTNEKPSSSNIFSEIAMLEVEYFDSEGVFTNKNITSAVLGVSSTIELNKKLDLVGSFGFSEGFNYNFLNSNILFNMSENFALFYGVGTYYISDERWNTQGIDGNEPSRYDFGMNMGLQISLGKYLGLTMKYNIIEEKEEGVNSMSINGLSFGLILK